MILAAILFPVFGAAQEKARASSCQSNLKQIGLAFHMYAQDFDQRTLLNEQTVIACPQTRLGPYIKNNQLWVCPSETNSTALLGTDPRFVSYQFNNQLANKTEALFTRPTELIITHDADAGEGGFTEGNTFDNGKTTDWPHLRTGGCANSGTGTDPKPCGMESYLQPEFNRHNGMFNALFVDGHVKTSRSSQFTDANFKP